jgi:hypothetical protein
MCDSPDVVSSSGDPIEPMTTLLVLVVTNKVLGLKSQFISKDRLVEPLSSKPRDDENSVRCQSFIDQLMTHFDFLIELAPFCRIVGSTALGPLWTRSRSGGPMVQRHPLVMVRYPHFERS